MRPFTFHSPVKLVFGAGIAKTVGMELVVLGAKRPMIITDPVVAATEGVSRMRKNLGEALAAVFDQVAPDSGVEIADRAISLARETGADSIVSIGGGSAIDTGKAVAAALGNGCGSASEIVGIFKLKKRPLPHVVVPTTAGTGSECSSMALLRDGSAGKKLIIADPKLVPDVGLLDPRFSATLPPAATAATGMDAFTHAAEALMSANSMPPADALAMSAIRLIAENLPTAVERGDDLEARGNMLIAAAEAGQAFQNAYVGVVHAMAHALGGRHGIPHGLANSVLLPIGMEYNLSTTPERVAMIGRAMRLHPAGDAVTQGRAAIEAVRKLTKQIGLPDNLEFPDDDLIGLGRLALEDGSILTNPRKPAGPEEIAELLRQAL